MALLVAVYQALALGVPTVAGQMPGHARLISGPAAWLLRASKDLGPAHTGRISVAAALQHTRRPGALIGWAQRHHLDVQWQPGADWAYIEAHGPIHAEDVSSSFGGQHDDRAADGQLGQHLHLE